MLKLQDAGPTTRDLAEFRPCNVVLVFFLGAECSHCTQKLRELVRDARNKLGPGTEIVAVSSRKIEDPVAALEMLGVNATDRFHLLVDENHQAFRAWGCFDKGPRHGLFLIDADCIIRASYTGEAPFGDTQSAVRAARELPRSAPTSGR